MDYTLAIQAFSTENNNAFLEIIKTVSPSIADEMSIKGDYIVFNPEDTYSRWNNEEEKLADVIAEHILTGSTCRIDWECTGSLGGLLIGKGKKLKIIYEAMAVTAAGSVVLLEAERTLAAGNRYYSTTWNYHQHRQHAFFFIAEWIVDVAAGDTVLGYQEWVEHQLESLLQETNLDSVDAIEVAGCTETDGFVDVVIEGEETPEFFSVYTHVPNRGVECICDFNTKGQAVEFAVALAARTGIPVYGNCCSLDVEPTPEHAYGR